MSILLTDSRLLFSKLITDTLALCCHDQWNKDSLYRRALCLTYKCMSCPLWSDSSTDDCCSIEIAQIEIPTHNALQSHCDHIVYSYTFSCMVQENSVPTQKGPSLAGLFFLHDRTYAIAPGKGGPEAKMNAENQLFHKLDTMAPREHISIQPGKMMVAVYNDNWYYLPCHIWKMNFFCYQGSQ